MARNYHTFDISFHMQSFRKDIVSTPFSLVFQTESENIEKYCKQKYPDLMEYSQYSPEQIRKLHEMRKYIKDNLKQIDIKFIHNFFYDRSWVDPFKIDDGLTTIELNGYNCKTWTDPQVPFLEVKGIIHFNISTLLKFYFKKNKLYFTKDNGVVTRNLDITFSSFPLLLTYRSSIRLKSALLSMFTQEINGTATTPVKSKVQMEMELKKIEEYKKNIKWNATNTLRIEITDTAKLLKLKIKESPVLPLVGGYILYKSIRGR